MRKSLYFFVLLITFCTTGFAQKTSKADAANEEIKTALATELNLPGAVADKVLVIENEFYAKLAAINALVDIPVKEKEKKLHEAHVTRCTKLMETPFTPRQMEDVIILVEKIRVKHKL